MGDVKKNGNGEGTIYKYGGRWYGQVTVGHDPETGKIIRKTFSGKRKKDVRKKVNELKYKLNQGTYKHTKDILFNDWIKKWNDGRRPSIAYSTWRNYDYFRRVHIKPELGDEAIKDLTTEQIQDFINEKYKHGRVKGEGEGLSERTIEYLYTTIHASLEAAVKRKILPYNVAEHVETPKKKKKEINYLDRQQAKIFLDAAKDSPYYTAFLLELYTGIRKSELLGLKWFNINFNLNSLTLNQQLLRTDEGLTLTELKTSNSYRTIPLSEEVIEQLKKHKSEQEKRKQNLGDKYHDKEYVFCLDNGKPIDHSNFHKEFKRILKKTGLPDIRFHDLRHTVATILVEQGTPSVTLQNLLGHHSSSFTIDTYVNSTQKLDKTAAKNISKALS